MPHSSPSITFDQCQEPIPTADQVRDILAQLSIEVGTGLREKLNEVLTAHAPGPFSDALGNLEAYLSALDDARLIPFENQIAIKAYAMFGWREWRSSFSALDV